MFARTFSIVLVCMVAMDANAACVRYHKPTDAPPGFDGPGSFGALQDTVTLECLKYVGTIRNSGLEQALIQDELGQMYTLNIGSYMGENTGVIVRIEDDAIYIKQAIRLGDKWQESIVKLGKSK